MQTFIMTFLCWMPIPHDITHFWPCSHSGGWALTTHLTTSYILLSKVIQLTLSSWIYLSHLHELWFISCLVSRRTWTSPPAVMNLRDLLMPLKLESVFNSFFKRRAWTGQVSLQVSPPATSWRRKNCPFSSQRWLNKTSPLCRVLTNIKLFFSIMSESQNLIDWHWLNSCGWVWYWKATHWGLKVRACFGKEAGQQH